MDKWRDIQSDKGYAELDLANQIQEGVASRIWYIVHHGVRDGVLLSIAEVRGIVSSVYQTEIYPE